MRRTRLSLFATATITLWAVLASTALAAQPNSTGDDVSNQQTCADLGGVEDDNNSGNDNSRRCAVSTTNTRIDSSGSSTTTQVASVRIDNGKKNPVTVSGTVTTTVVLVITYSQTTTETYQWANGGGGKWNLLTDLTVVGPEVEVSRVSSTSTNLDPSSCTKSNHGGDGKPCEASDLARLIASVG